MVSFRRADRERVAAGDITVTFRLWKSARVKAGNRYATGFGTIEVEDVQLVPAGLVQEQDVAPSGCASIQAIWALAGEHTHTQITRDTLLYRVQFRFVGLPASSAAAAETDPVRLAARLARMDRASSRGPWTERVLRLIDAAPHVPARVLAGEMGWPAEEFKAHVRRLKALGLTISHEVGYELADAGRRYLASIASSMASAGGPTLRPRGGGARSPRTRARSR